MNFEDSVLGMETGLGMSSLTPMIRQRAKPVIGDGNLESIGAPVIAGLASAYTGAQALGHAGHGAVLRHDHGAAGGAARVGEMADRDAGNVGDGARLAGAGQ